MLLVDVNVLLYAHRSDSPNHLAYRSWLEAVINGGQTYGMTDIVIGSFLRIATHPRIFDPPSEMSAALNFSQEVREHPNCIRVLPGPRHWRIFTELCKLPHVRGNLVQDAFLAALAIESGSEWITTDRDFGRFPGLNWRHPLDPESESG